MAAVVKLGPGKLCYLEKLIPQHHEWQQWEVCYCGICKTDRALAWSDQSEGRVLGHEVVCRGTDGRYRVLNNEIPCGECEYCQEDWVSHCLHKQELGITHHGGFATHICAPDSSLHTLSLSDPRLGVLVEPLACVMHGLSRLTHAAALQHNSAPRVLIVGSGVAGKMFGHLLLHRWTQAHLALCDIHDDAMAWAQSYPIVCQQTPQDRHYHMVIECSGSRDGMLTALAAVRDAGVVMIYGVPQAGETLPVSAREMFERELTLMASMSGCTQSIFLQALSYVEQHQAFFATLLGKKTDLRQLPYELLYNPPLPGTRSWVVMSPGRTGSGD